MEECRHGLQRAAEGRLSSIHLLELIQIQGNLLKPLGKQPTINQHEVSLGEVIPNERRQVGSAQATVPKDSLMVRGVQKGLSIPEILAPGITRGQSLSITPPLGGLMTRGTADTAVPRQPRIEE